MSHDHDHGGGGGGMEDHPMSCPMIMSFHAGNCETILWTGWTVTKDWEIGLSTLAIFIIAFAYEGLKYFRERLYHSKAQAELSQISRASAAMENGPPSNGNCCAKAVAGANNNNNRTMKEKLFNEHHATQTVLHFAQVSISYLLMLIVMTFNYWLCLAVMLGAAAGYFCFGWIRQQAVDFNEHCH